MQFEINDSHRNVAQKPLDLCKIFQVVFFVSFYLFWGVVITYIYMNLSIINFMQVKAVKINLNQKIKSC